MRVRLLAFATAAERLGAPSLELEVADDSSVGDLRRLLATRHPDLGSLGTRLAVAVDGEIVGDDRRLADGCEVALLPPVSGGRPERVGLTDGPLSTEEVAQRVRGPGRGALVLFLGTVRDHHAGRPVARLTYTAYRPLAERRLRRIVEETEAATDSLRLAIVHRLGCLEVGETSVVIAAAAAHRDAAYRANRRALERLKAEVPIWKQEHYADGGVAWREEEPLLPSPPAESPEPGSPPASAADLDRAQG